MRHNRAELASSLTPPAQLNARLALDRIPPAPPSRLDGCGRLLLVLPTCHLAKGALLSPLHWPRWRRQRRLHLAILTRHAHDLDALRARRRGGCRQAALLLRPQRSLAPVNPSPLPRMPPASQPSAMHSATQPHVGSVLKQDDPANLSATRLRISRCAAGGPARRLLTSAAALTRSLRSMAASYLHQSIDWQGVHGSHLSKSSMCPQPMAVEHDATKTPEPLRLRTTRGAPFQIQNAALGETPHCVNPHSLGSHAKRTRERPSRVSLSSAPCIL
jgi:hypothetical protein